MNIGRTMFWFKDGDKSLITINEDFFGIATMLNRLLNEKYDGKKIKFINLDFSTNKTYELYPVLPKKSTYYYGGHLTFYGMFDINQFNNWNWYEKKYFVWERACDYIKKSAEFTKNKKLFDAVEYAKLKGIENNLNPDYSMLSINVDIKNQNFKISLWIIFKEDAMYSKLVIEDSTSIILEKIIDKSSKGVEFFLEIYKDLEYDGNNIILKGRKNIDYLPLKLPISEFVSI